MISPTATAQTFLSHGCSCHACKATNHTGTLRNLPRPSGTNVSEPSGTRPRNLHLHTPELSGTFRNLPPEPAPATRTGTHRTLSGLKTPLAYAVGEKNMFFMYTSSLLFYMLQTSRVKNSYRTFPRAAWQWGPSRLVPEVNKKPSSPNKNTTTLGTEKGPWGLVEHHVESCYPV